MNRPYTIRRAKADVIAAQTDTVIIPAQTTPLPRKIRLLAALISGGAAATTVVFNTKPGGAGTAISHTINVGAGAVVAIPVSEYAWFETNAGEGLSITTGAGAGVGVTVLYDDQG